MKQAVDVGTGILKGQQLRKWKRQIFIKRCKNQKALLFLSGALLLYIFLFSYVPVFGWIMAFQEYKPGPGMLHSEFVGLDQFRMLFSDSMFWNALRNTLGMSALNMIFGFTTAILLALFLNEMRCKWFKKTVQTISYLPHFVSWVVASNIVLMCLSVDGGVINEVLMTLGIIKEPVLWMGKPQFFWGIIVLSNIWKEVGWNAIIYLAALTSIDSNLYEAASIDGAGRIQRILHITLPGIMPIIRIMLIMQCGWLLSTGFEQQLLLQNPMVLEVADVLDTYTLRYGMSMNRYSYAAAAGIFKSVVSVIVLVAANKVSKKISGEGIM